MPAFYTLSRGNADPERGFSTNKHMLSVYGKPMEALCLVKDCINLHGGMSKIKVCKNLIRRCSMAREHYEEDLKAQRALKEDEEEAKKKKTEKEEARQKRKLLESELRTDLERTNKNLKLFNELLKDGESELESLKKAEKVDKNKLPPPSAKISTSLKRAELQ